MLILYILASLIGFSWCSVGDSSTIFGECWEKCTRLNCSDMANMQFVSSKPQPLHLKLLLWTCDEECKYDCMWKTIDEFHKRKWQTPQFYGKWPFIRVLGIQELASALFSLFNFYVHLKWIIIFRREVSSQSPLYWVWNIFALINLNAWFWSTIFHSRDTPFTEFMDYACAFSIILSSCYVMCYRIIHEYAPRSILIIITTFFVAFFYNHAIYLYMGRFDYGYNMRLNILVGSSTGICWFLWCGWKRKKLWYVSYCSWFVLLSGAALLLETWDAEPLWYILDTHAVWHFTTALLISLMYKFAIEDCKYLRKQMLNASLESGISIKKQ